MARILFFILLAFVVWLVVRMAGSQRPRATRRDASTSTTQTPAMPAEAVTQCAWCGAHVPAGAALSLPDGRIYCSGAHREEARLALAKSGSVS